MVSIDGTEISDLTIDGDAVSEVTMDGDVVWTAIPNVPTEADYHYLMNEGSGSTLNNDIGGNDISLSGVSWGSGAGHDDIYADFSGSGNYGRWNDDTDIFKSWATDNTGCFFIWVKTIDSSSRQTIMGTDWTSNFLLDYGRFGGNLSLSAASGDIEIESSKNPNDNEWHSIAGRADGSRGYLYLDGEKVGDDNASGTSTSSQYPGLGDDGTNQRYWDGYLSDLWFGTEDCGEEEIVDYYNGTKHLYK